MAGRDQNGMIPHRIGPDANRAGPADGPATADSPRADCRGTIEGPRLP
jgi:hypothetical protein